MKVNKTDHCMEKASFLAAARLTRKIPDAFLRSDECLLFGGDDDVVDRLFLCVFVGLGGGSTSRRRVNRHSRS